MERRNLDRSGGNHDGVLLEVDRSLSQEASGDSCPGAHRDTRLAQDRAHHAAGRSKRGSAPDLPEDSVRRNSTIKKDLGARAHGKVACNLEDEDIVGIAIEGDARRNQDRGTPGVHSRVERQTTNGARAEVEGG